MQYFQQSHLDHSLKPTQVFNLFSHWLVIFSFILIGRCGHETASKCTLGVLCWIMLATLWGSRCHISNYASLNHSSTYIYQCTWSVTANSVSLPISSLNWLASLTRVLALITSSLSTKGFLSNWIRFSLLVKKITKKQSIRFSVPNHSNYLQLSERLMTPSGCHDDWLSLWLISWYSTKFSQQIYDEMYRSYKKELITCHHTTTSLMIRIPN